MLLLYALLYAQFNKAPRLDFPPVCQASICDHLSALCMCVSSWTPPSSPGRDVEMGYLFNSDAGEEFPWGVFDLGCLNCHFNRLGIRYSVPHARTAAA